MQKWYNELTKGQRIVIWATMFAIFFGIGAAIGDHPITAMTIGVIGLAPCLFFEFGRRKS